MTTIPHLVVIFKKKVFLCCFGAVQDVLISSIDELTTRVGSLEEKYVQYLYRKLNALENCSPCKPESGNTTSIIRYEIAYIPQQIVVWSFVLTKCSSHLKTRNSNENLKMKSHLIFTDWGIWSAWSQCSCEQRNQTRNRKCINGKTCTGVNTEQKSCQPYNCQS